MTEDFELEVPYNNSIKIFPATFSKLGYSYKIIVVIDGEEIVFDRDEERNFRATGLKQHYSAQLLLQIKAVMETLHTIF
ncbi:MAG: hypothetical protein QM764_20895 [Chitinophagaceae bacterium]